MEGKERGANYHWEYKEECVLMECLLQMKQMGKKHEKNFSNECWGEIIFKIQRETGHQSSIYNAKNKMKNWRTRYKEVKQLLNMSGFGWDSTCKMVVASEDVWAPLIEAKSKLAKYRNMTIKFYDDIHELVSDDVAEGDIALTGVERSTMNVETMMNDAEFVSQHTTGIDEINGTCMLNEESGPSEPCRDTTPPQTRKNKSSRKRKTASDEVKETLVSIAGVVHSLAERIHTAEPLHMLINRITAAVTSLPFIEKDMQVHIIDFIAQDERKANIFLSLNDEMKE